MASTTVYETIRASQELPSPTGTALRILRLAQDENSTMEEIAAAVESDPAVSSRLLKLVNSPLAGMSRQIASVQRAVALLGVRTVTSLSLSFSLVSGHRHGKCLAFNYELFWSEAVARAAAARHISNRLRSFAPDEAFTCGLLSQIGRLAMATVFPGSYAEVLETVVGGNNEELSKIERAVCGIDHNELAAEMMGDWHMPAIFRDAVRIQDDPGGGGLEPASRVYQFARVLHLAGSVSRILVHPTVYRETLSTLVLESNGLGIGPHVYHEVFDAISQEWRDAGQILSVRTRRVPSLAEIYTQAQEQRSILTEQGPEGSAAVIPGGYCARG